jgi:hypothetical protein
MTTRDSGFQVGYVPVTPGGTYCFWLASKTEDKAWEKLLKDAAHMPYRGIEGFRERGYTVEKVEKL